MPESATKNAQEERAKTRSVPRQAYVHSRCLHCGKIDDANGASLLDPVITEFYSRMFDHTAETRHRVQITVTESFWIDPQ